MNRRRTAVVIGVAAAGVAAAGGAWATAGSGGGRSPDAYRPTRIATSTAAVERTDVADRALVGGTLSHSGSYNVIAPGGQGVLTRLPAAGAVIDRGRAAYEVNGDPVPLFYGSRPPWRPFALGMSDGPDVRELERNLSALGHGSGLTVDRHFSLATYHAVRRWQHAAGLPVTGTVPLGQVVFLPGPLRVTVADTKAGSPVRPGAPIEHGTSSTRTVEAQLDPALAPQVVKGDKVLVTMPDGRTVRGRITHVSPVAVAQSQSESEQQGGPPPQPLVPITISLGRIGGGTLDQAQVQISMTTELHPHVLAVPILALLARPGGAYEVVVVASGGVRRHLPVRPGLFDETAGIVEVSGAGLAEGQRVEVPDDRS
jgi:peptidoglycan hydrolase-like protein with peptidoglycan-binding domain